MGRDTIVNLYFDPTRYADSGYSRGHKQVRYVRGTPSECEECHSTTAIRYEWASLNGDWLNPADYIRLCNPCHQKFDGSGWRSSPRANEMRSKTHCPKGHEYTPENTMLYNGGRFINRRACRTCHNVRSRQDRARKREQVQNKEAQNIAWLPAQLMRPDNV